MDAGLRGPPNGGEHGVGYRGTSLIRNAPTLGPNSRPMPRDL